MDTANNPLYLIIFLRRQRGRKGGREGKGKTKGGEREGRAHKKEQRRRTEGETAIKILEELRLPGAQYNPQVWVLSVPWEQLSVKNSQMHSF